MDLDKRPHPAPAPSMSTDTVFGDAWANIGIPASGLLGIAFALFLWHRVSALKVRGGAAGRAENGREYLLEEEQRGEAEVRSSSVWRVAAGGLGWLQCAGGS